MHRSRSLNLFKGFKSSPVIDFTLSLIRYLCSNGDQDQRSEAFCARWKTTCIPRGVSPASPCLPRPKCLWLDAASYRQGAEPSVPLVCNRLLLSCDPGCSSRVNHSEENALSNFMTHFCFFLCQQKTCLLFSPRLFVWKITRTFKRDCCIDPLIECTYSPVSREWHLHRWRMSHFRRLSVRPIDSVL